MIKAMPISATRTLDRARNNSLSFAVSGYEMWDADGPGLALIRDLLAGRRALKINDIHSFGGASTCERRDFIEIHMYSKATM